MKFNTMAIHAGGKTRNPENALNPPLFMTSTFCFDNTDCVEDVMSFKSSDYVYTRGNNPTLRLLEERVAALEQGAAAVAFASGMAAVSSVLFSLLKQGDHIIAHRALYGSSHSVITKLLADYGVAYTIVDMRSAAALESAFRDTTRVVYFETPANPSLDIIDIQAVCAAAKRRGIRVVVDNTFASPFFQNPLTLGADVVVHSATKYLSGHGDVVAGIAVAADGEYAQRLKFGYMCEFGGVMSPFNAWLILRGIKTLGLRMKAHEANARAAVDVLRAHPCVKAVHYPGLADHTGFDSARRQMSGFGGIVSFEPAGGLKAAERFVNAAELFRIAVSLGDCETLVELPSRMTHRSYSGDELAKAGFSESTVRLSLGLEDACDITQELQRMLEAI